MIRRYIAVSLSYFGQYAVLGLVYLFLWSSVFVPVTYAFSNNKAQKIYGPVRRTDRLWQIARLERPSPRVNLQKMALAILDKNPHAFISGNVNRLKRGSVLKIPSRDEVQAVSLSQAQHKLEFQNRDWLAFKSIKRVHSKPLQISHQVLAKTLAPQLVEVTNALHHYQTDTDDQLKMLTLESVLLQDQMVQLDHSLLELGGFLLKTRQAMLDKEVPSTFSLPSYLMHLLKPFMHFTFVLPTWFSYIIFPSTFLFLLGILLIWIYSCSRRSSTQSSIQSNNSGKYSEEEHLSGESGEYDYLGSQEGIRAKLDLARTYIDMADLKSAKDCLQSVIQSGSEPEKQEAMQLLASLPTQ